MVKCVSIIDNEEVKVFAPCGDLAFVVRGSEITIFPKALKDGETVVVGCERGLSRQSDKQEAIAPRPKQPNSRLVCYQVQVKCEYSVKCPRQF